MGHRAGREPPSPRPVHARHLDFYTSPDRIAAD